MPPATPRPAGRRVHLARPLPEFREVGRLLDEHVHDALTDMYAYALALEAESRRLASKEVREEVAALRKAINALRLHVDPIAGWG